MTYSSETLDTVLSRLRGVAIDTPDTHMALIDGKELLALIECAEELRNIINAKRFNPKHFEDDTAFVEWAQSRARHTLTKLEAL